MNIDDADEDQIYQAWLVGRTERAIARDKGLSVEAVNAIVKRRMPRLDHEYRAKDMTREVERLHLLQARYFRDALEGDSQALNGYLRIAQRLAAMLGTDAPMRIDAVQIVQHTGTNIDKIEAVLNDLLLTDQSKPH